MATDSLTSSIEFDIPQCDQTTPLLSLPLEIRTIIYSHIIPVHRILHPRVTQLFHSAKEHEDGRDFHSHENTLGLARTCQAFYTDLLSIYYGTNTFAFTSAYNSYRYLYMIGPFRRSCMKNIEVWLRGGLDIWWNTKTREVYKWMVEVLKECSGLEKFVVGVSSETTQGMKGPVEGLEGLKGMGLSRLEVRVKEVCDWGYHIPGIFEGGREPQELQRYPEFKPCFKPEQLLGLEQRLRGYMMTETESTAEGQMDKHQEEVIESKGEIKGKNQSTALEQVPKDERARGGSRQQPSGRTTRSTSKTLLKH